MKEEFEDVNQEDQKKKDKRTNNNLQKITQKKTKDRATRSPLKTGGEIRCSGREGS